MRIKNLNWAIVLSCFVLALYVGYSHCQDASSTTRKPILPSLSYRELAINLSRDRGLQNVLRLTDEQSVQVRSIVEDEQLRNKFRQKFRDSVDLPYASGIDSREVANYAMNEDFERELRKVLDDYQFDRLYWRALEQRFAHPCSVFSNNNVLASFNVDPNERGKLLAAARDEARISLERLVKRQHLSARVILEHFSHQQRIQFVQVFGNTLFPNISVDTNVDTVPLPMIDIPAIQLLNEPRHRETLGISELQLETLRENEHSVNNEINKLKSNDAGFADATKLLQLKYLDKCIGILTESQKKELRRVRVFSTFLNDFTSPFKDGKILAYLGIPDDETNFFLNAARKENEAIMSFRKQDDREIFERMCGLLPKKNEQWVREIFSLCW